MGHGCIYLPLVNGQFLRCSDFGRRRLPPLSRSQLASPFKWRAGGPGRALGKGPAAPCQAASAPVEALHAATLAMSWRHEPVRGLHLDQGNRRNSLTC
jgi:hypothetical protein